MSSQPAHLYRTVCLRSNALPNIPFVHKKGRDRDALLEKIQSRRRRTNDGGRRMRIVPKRHPFEF